VHHAFCTCELSCSYCTNKSKQDRHPLAVCGAFMKLNFQSDTFVKNWQHLLLMCSQQAMHCWRNPIRPPQLSWVFMLVDYRTNLGVSQGGGAECLKFSGMAPVFAAPELAVPPYYSHLAKWPIGQDLELCSDADLIRPVAPVYTPCTAALQCRGELT
jgi:hypothetical protein